MDKFIVSARKYRPQNFNTVVGQSHITTTLKNAINNNQLAHAFLFCGPRGVGKTTCARILAKTINCENKTADGEACNQCNSCVSFDNGTSLNIHELDAASNNSVEDIRTLVEQVRFAPQAGEYKVYIVDEVHMLTSAAFNAFLKTLEEPPHYAIFILATTEKHKILPTILSRCQIFDFRRITINDTVEHLHEICEKEDISAEKAALHIIAQKSEGCMRDSLSILDKIVSFTDGKLTYSNTLEHLNILDEDYYFSLLEHLQAQHLSDALLLLDTILQKGFETDTFIEGLAEFVRNLLVSKDNKALVLLEVAEDFKAKYSSWAQKTDAGWILAALNLLSEGSIGLKTARNKKLFTEMLLIKLSYLQQAIELQDENGLVKKKRTDNSKAIAFRAIASIKPAKEIAAPIAKHKPAAPAEAGLYIEEKAPAYTPQSAPATATAPTGTAQPKGEGKPLSLASLSRLRQQAASQAVQEQVAAIPMQAELLQHTWNSYIEILKSKNLHSSVTIFKSSAVTVLSEDSFEIKVNQTQFQRFIEVEREGLLEHFKSVFHQPGLSYQIVVSSDAEDETEENVVPLSEWQKFELMSKQYPNLLLLKEKLRLDIG